MALSCASGQSRTVRRSDPLTFHTPVIRFTSKRTLFDVDGQVVTFGTLFEDFELANTLESLAGTLKAGKRRKYWAYGPELLLQGLSDTVDITLLRETLGDNSGDAASAQTKENGKSSRAAEEKPEKPQQQQQQSEPEPAARSRPVIIRSSCPECSREHKLKPELEGKRIRCKGCNSAFRVVKD